MQHCVKCVMPDTRPGIKFNEDGVCYPCANAERKKEVNWGARSAELLDLCGKHRKVDGSYDCIVTVSGGKDSHVQVHMLKEVMGMNPLLLNVYNLSWTRTGLQNFDNIQERFGCDCISLHLNRKVARLMTRKAFEKYGSPTWYWDRAVYAYPLQMAIKLKIPLLVYGENINYEYGGTDVKETPSAKDQIYNDVVKPIPFEDWIDDEITIKDLQQCVYPTAEELEEIEPIYLSYFMEWSGWENAKKAKTFGFKSLGDTGEWKREGYIEDYDQIDSAGYLVHPWMKYPKFGHARTTDIASNLIREGKMSRDYAVQLVKENDWRLDTHAFNDFCAFTGYTAKEFWDIADKFFNKDIFKKTNGQWILKEPIWNESSS